MVDYRNIQIDTAILLDTLRNMQSYRRLTPNDSSMYLPPFRTESKPVLVRSRLEG
jgi:hypothetical protein